MQLNAEKPNERKLTSKKKEFTKKPPQKFNRFRHYSVSAVVYLRLFHQH